MLNEQTVSTLNALKEKGVKEKGVEKGVKSGVV